MMKILMLMSLAATAALAAPTCPVSYGSLDSAKPNKLYLYFPVANDNTYPEFGLGGLTTSPAHRFDASELTSYTGNVTDLRNRIFDVVTDDYCEFNVQVLKTTTAPPNTFARRNTVAAGTDTDPTGSGTFGLAQNVDTNDTTPVDFARVWAGTYQTQYGGGGGALNGVNSTLDRWARAIGGTMAHEAGHNYGLAHSDGLPLAPGEDPLVHHIMASGSHYSGEDRAGYRRHFSDHEYSILAANVGLSIQTMWNWDFVNPNAQTGFKLRMNFLSTKPSLILSWSYAGATSPWVNPTITGPSGTTMFKGTSYHNYQIEWSAGQAWANGPSGQVPGGAPFHVGATFSGVSFSDPDAIVITDVILLDNSNAPLSLRPRHLAFDAGTVDQADGALNVHFFNINGNPLILQNVVVHELPRVISLDAMVPGARMVDPYGLPFQPWPQGVRLVLQQSKPIETGGELKIPVARLNQRPHVVETIDERACNAQDRLSGADTRGCRTGVSTDLFPATTLYITATVIDPKARYWDPKLKAYVTGPLASQLFYQIAGRRLKQSAQ